ncbi:MAG: hypothetical protein AAFQ88_00205 [Pseudomonadota bacterium]
MLKLFVCLSERDLPVLVRSQRRSQHHVAKGKDDQDAQTLKQDDLHREQDRNTVFPRLRHDEKLEDRNRGDQAREQQKAAADRTLDHRHGGHHPAETRLIH